MHLKVRCSDFGTVRDRGSLSYLPKNRTNQLGKLRGDNPKMNQSRVGRAMPIYRDVNPKIDCFGASLPSNVNLEPFS